GRGGESVVKRQVLGRRRELRGQLGRGERSVGLRPPVAVELPHVADFEDLVEVEVRHHDLVPIARGLRDTPAARIAKIALAVELADVPWLLVADPVDGAMGQDRKSTRLNSSHVAISYAVFCLKKKKNKKIMNKKQHQD